MFCLFVFVSFRWKGGFGKGVKVCRSDLISYSVKRNRKFICQATVILKISTVPEILHPINQKIKQIKQKNKNKNKKQNKKQQNKS